MPTISMFFGTGIFKELMDIHFFIQLRTALIQLNGQMRLILTPKYCNIKAIELKMII